MIRIFTRIAVCVALGLCSVVTTQALSVSTAAAVVIGSYDVSGPILAKYQSIGGEGVAGEPVDEQYQTSPRTGIDGVWQEFENGKIFWSADTGASWVKNGPLLDRYWECAFFCHGMPTSDIISGAKGSKILKLQYGGSFYWSSSQGVHVLSDEVLAKYVSMGSQLGTKSFIGLPTSDVNSTADGEGTYATFEWGTIVWSQGAGAHEVHGAIRWKWNTLGGVNGALGYPTSDEHSVPGGRQSDFEGGSIKWTASTGKLTVTYK